MSNLFVDINTELIEAAEKDVTFLIEDGDGQLRSFNVNVPPKFENPYRIDLNQFIPQTKVFNLDRFFELALQLINKESNNSVSFVEEYPPQDMESLGKEVITFRLIKREPAAMSADATTRKQKGFRNYYDTKESNYGDNVIQIYNRPLDHEIEFSIWAVSNKLANKRAIWLEDLFVKHKWVFTSEGADRFFFERRLQDGYLLVGKQKLFYRPLRFSLRFNDFMIRANYEIKDIEIALNLKSEI